MDTLTIEGLRLPARIGVHAWEQRITQPLLIDLHLGIDISGCADDISAVIDYDALSQKLRQHLETNSYQLIESVANALANLIKEQYKVSVLTLSVSKPQALGNASNVQITVRR